MKKDKKQIAKRSSCLIELTLFSILRPLEVAASRQKLLTSLTGQIGSRLKRYLERHCFSVREGAAHSCHGFGKFQCSRALFVEDDLVGPSTGLSAAARVPCLLHCATHAAAGSERLRLGTISKLAIDHEWFIEATDLASEGDIVACTRDAVGPRALFSYFLKLCHVLSNVCTFGYTV